MHNVMTALLNVNTRRGGSNPPNSGLTSGVILELPSSQQAMNSDAGVSSHYAQKENHSWFVLRATYNRVEKDFDILAANVVYAYLPKHYTLKLVNGKKKRIMEPLLPNLVFVYSTQEHIERTFLEHKELSHYHFYRNRTLEISSFDGKHPPVTIPHHEMMNFIRLTSVESEHIRVVSPEQCHYKNGDKVRIIDGEFAGVEGRVARIAGQQRVVVEMQGVCMVATAYVPNAFLEKISF